MTDKDDGTMRSFNTGATRDTSEGKLDYEGFLSPFVLRQYARFMHMNQLQSDGNTRSADNWQKGIPMDVYRKSLNRHYMEFWTETRIQELVSKAGDIPREGDLKLMASACGMLFNIMGYMHEWLKNHKEVRFDDDEPTPEMRERQDNIKGTDDTDEDDMCLECYGLPCICNEESTFLDDMMDEEEQADIDPLPAPGEPWTVDRHRCYCCRFIDTTPDQHPCDCCEYGSNYSPK